jgi:hypothetical protein
VAVEAVGAARCSRVQVGTAPAVAAPVDWERAGKAAEVVVGREEKEAGEQVARGTSQGSHLAL